MTSKYSSNQVLGITQPPIDETETYVSWSARTRLVQFRSGYSCPLNSYGWRISPAIADAWSSFQATPHNIQQLLNCSALSKHCTPEELRTNPARFARFLHPLLQYRYTAQKQQETDDPSPRDRTTTTHYLIMHLRRHENNWAFRFVHSEYKLKHLNLRWVHQK